MMTKQEIESVIVTTSQDDIVLQEKAVEKAKFLGLPFVERKKRSIQSLCQAYECNKILVLEQKRWVLKSVVGDFFFHPNMAILRILALQRGDKDHLAEALNLRHGDSFLDCTVGLASDAIVASYLVGEKGKVVGIEHNALVAFIVAEGLAQPYHDISEPITRAMTRIQIQQGDHREILETISEKSYDVLYFDPMFRQEVTASSGINNLRQLADQRPLALESIEKARTIARRRVVVKERRASKEWERLQPPHLTSSQNMKVAYGYWERE
ncbi:hypothetical protein F9B85_00465 [Heliorestis acidaminivorans]|uniref:Class I SAM-dependent methyltransferase n=1 Tax=Heliorestis acidaminivorans TaxID=553427 RepID=A0A6I0F9G9_9FIRM|nr:class I SAM-dependent methyltransferase [Heliorestis acidaminivorans]KAB2954208.1 hypothetical protein F9B85_00465 [Heliorestis acidaminivorans]